MGRPIKKKFFGNTITPYDNHATSGKTGVGGEGVASITTATAGSININDSYPNFPTLTIADPGLTGGITAVSATTWEVDTVTITTGTGYTTGTITSITGLDTYANTPTRFTVTQTGGFPAFNAFTDRGEYTSIDATGVATWNVQGPTGTNAQATVKFRVKRIGLSNPGSGYLTAPSLSWTSLSGTTPSAQTPALTTTRPDSIRFASKLSGGSVRTTGDILKQEASHRYLIQNTDGKGICKLVAKENADLLAGEMNIIATDYNGNTYFVTKLTARKARLVQYQNNEATWLVADGGVAGWTIGAATATRVSIAHTN